MTEEEIARHNKMVEFDQRASDNMRRWAKEDEKNQRDEPRDYPRFVLNWPDTYTEEEDE